MTGPSVERDTPDTVLEDDPFEALLRQATHVPRRVVLSPGAVLGGRYRLDRLLGEGGMGVVWAATHQVTGARAALKLMAGAGHTDTELRQRFLREARAASQVEHPAIVAVRDVFELEHGELVMVMDLLEGETLRARLDRDRALALGDAARLLLPVAQALAAAHARGIIHRDLKPENVFLVSEGESESSKVLDFGLAKLVASASGSTLTRTGQPVGTPAYMAPEQVYGESELDARVDVWAFGTVLYECLAGRRLVEAGGIGQMGRAFAEGRAPSLRDLPAVPEEVEQLLSDLLVLDRKRRQRDLSHAIEVLSRCPEVGPAPVRSRRGTRGAVPARRWLYGAGALALAAGLAMPLLSKREPGPVASTKSPIPLPAPMPAPSVLAESVSHDSTPHDPPPVPSTGPPRKPARPAARVIPAATATREQPANRSGSDPGSSGVIEKVPF